MEKCFPLELTNKIVNKYPECWNQVKIFREGKAKGDLEWDDLCYIPIAATIAIVTNGTLDPDQLAVDSRILAATASWRIYKQIYSFPVEMETLLFEQGNDIAIPADVLRNLPYPCIYVETHTLADINGFFFHFESDVNTRRLEMRFLLLTENLDCIPYIVHMILGGTLKNGLDEYFEEANRNAREIGCENYNWSASTDDYEVIYKLMQLVLYICAQNKEITESPETKRTFRKPKSEDSIKDKYREVQKWNLGTEISQTIRKMNQRPSAPFSYRSNESAGIGSPKSPHVRRGHWHHFWTGKRDGERKRILKWVPPTFINADKVEETPGVTINKI